MSDPFPDQIEIPIDRQRLTRYLRAKWILSWLGILGFLGLMMGVISVVETFKHVAFSWRELLMTILVSLALSVLPAALFAVALDFAFSHRLASRFAEELKLTVEGPFLRIRDHLFVVTDRRLHFRSILDYAVAQDPLMHYFQIHALQMTTPAGGPAATIKIPGIEDCFRVRDMLCEIDLLREDMPHGPRLPN